MYRRTLILNNPAARDELSGRLLGTTRVLGGAGASARAAEAVIEKLEGGG